MATTASRVEAIEQAAIRPFQVNVPAAELTELRRRVSATRWPERELVADISNFAYYKQS